MPVLARSLVRSVSVCSLGVTVCVLVHVCACACVHALLKLCCEGTGPFSQAVFRAEVSAHGCYLLHMAV